MGGYVYAIGRFEAPSADFDPGPGEANLTATSLYDIFFAKYSATDGSLVWAKDIGVDGVIDYVYDTAIDATGNLYLTGYFQDTMNFDPDGGSTTLTSSGERDVFFAKYASADGSLVWVKGVGAPGGANAQDYPYSIDVDASNNIYITGRLKELAIMIQA